MTLDIPCESNQLDVICGVDEAGKGAVLGPLVIAGVACADEGDCEGFGFRDSKLLSAGKREELFSLIASRFRVAFSSVPPDEIDLRRTHETMNELLAAEHAGVILQLQARRAYVDACDVNSARYGIAVRGHCGHQCDIIAEHRADTRYPVVSAASIVAKVMRDRAIDKLRAEYGNIGSGYPSDPATVAFLSSYIDENRCPPACARRSWKTVAVMMDALGQSVLSDF
jgi:ribonuclease HII